MDLDGLNPVTDADIPNKAVAACETHAYCPDEVIGILNALEGVARAAVALQYFCALRPGEARATRWDDYNVDKGLLRVKASIWRKHETAPKTEKSCGVVPAAHLLRASPSCLTFPSSSLRDLPGSQACGPA